MPSCSSAQLWAVRESRGADPIADTGPAVVEVVKREVADRLVKPADTLEIVEGAIPEIVAEAGLRETEAREEEQETEEKGY
jgi:hypothetical protein